MEEEKKDMELFSKVRRMTNVQAQADTFGKMADNQDSKPVKIANFEVKDTQYLTPRNSPYIDLNEQYFSNFKPAHYTTPRAQAINNLPPTQSPI